jgi:hypothetical protein
MVLYLALGTIIAFLLARLTTNAIANAVVAGIADEGLAGAVDAVVEATLADLRGLTVIILIATAILAVAAYLWGRPAWLTSAAGQVGSTAGRAGSAAGAGVGAVAAQRPSRASVEDTVRENRVTVERVGIAIIVFLVAWLALGPTIAFIGLALVIGFELVLHAIESDDAEPDATATPSVTRPRPPSA